MAYFNTIQLVAGDDRPEINLTIRDANTAVAGLNLDPDDVTTWAPIDISGHVVRVKFRALGSASVLDTIICVKLFPYTDGKCFMPWNPATLDVPAGTYEGEIELTSAEGSVLTIFDRLKFKVRSEF